MDRYEQQITLPRLERAIRLTSERFGYTVDELVEQDRHRPRARVRQLTYYIARVASDASYPAIGRALSRDHRTVMYGCEQAQRRLEGDEHLAGIARELVRKARAEELLAELDSAVKAEAEEEEV